MPSEREALQVLVDFVIEHFRGGAVHMDRSWGSRGYTLEDRLDHVLRYAQMAGAAIPSGIELAAPWDGDAEVRETCGGDRS